MRAKRMIGILALAAGLTVPGMSVYGATIPLVVSYDAHIDGVNVLDNYGTNDVLSLEQTALGGNKAYLMFDASGWGTKNIARVEGLRVYWSASTGITRSLWFGLITGEGANDWTETGITWSNAPANNVTGTDRNFVAYPGQTVMLIGSIQYAAGNPRELFIPFAEYSAEEALLMAALNYGDRKATIGVRYNSSQSTAVGLYSREREGGIYAAELQVIEEVPPGTPVSFVVQPQSVTVTNGPYRKATFTAEGYGSLPVTYQWLTNGVEVAGAIGTSLSLPAETTELDGTLVSVRIDNFDTPDPGIVSTNAVLTIIERPATDGVIYANADMYYAGDTVNNAYNVSGQVWYGLTAFGGATQSPGNRSYIGFTFGTQHVSSAALRLFMYWGGPEVNMSGKLAKGEIRIWGSTNSMTLTEPPVGTSANWTTDPAWEPPATTNFVQVTQPPDQAVGPEIGWYDFDITEFYNSRLGLPTVIRLAGVRASGFDDMLFEDHENSAYNAFAGGTWPNSGPRIEYILGPPWIKSVDVAGNQLVMAGSAPRNGSDTFYVLATSNPGTAPGSWTSVSTNQFDADGNFSVSIPIDAGAAQKFYMLQVP